MVNKPLNAVDIRGSRRRSSHAAQVGAYYDSCHWWYRLFYSDAESLGIHYGFWNGPDATRADALVEPYLDIMRRLKPMEGDHILDAGCGVGGATLWMAEHSRAHYTGLTLSDVQLKAARSLAERRALAGRADFQRLDYCRTGLPAESFDGVFSIESLCYTYPEPEIAFQEIHRLLRRAVARYWERKAGRWQKLRDPEGRRRCPCVPAG